MTIIRAIDSASHQKADQLAMQLIKGEINSRKGLSRDKEAANPAYTEEYDNGLIICEYYRRADLKETTWHGTVTDLQTDKVFTFSAETLTAVRVSCVRVIRNRYHAKPEATEPEDKKLYLFLNDDNTVSIFRDAAITDLICNVCQKSSIELLNHDTNYIWDDTERCRKVWVKRNYELTQARVTHFSIEAIRRGIPPVKARQFALYHVGEEGKTRVLNNHPEWPQSKTT